VKATLALLLAIAGPAMAGDVFQVPEEQVVASVHVVALAPLRDLTKDGAPSAALVRWEAVLTEELTALGLKVVPSTEFARVWGALASELGGVWDPVTGKADAKKLKAARQHTFGELQRLHGIDAVIDWHIVESHTSRLWSEWHTFGKQVWKAGDETLQLGGAPLVLRANQERPTRVLVVDLSLFLSDRNDVTLYQGTLEVAWTEVRHGARRERRPAAEVFAPDRDVRIRAMLKPLREAFDAAAGKAKAEPSAGS